MAQKIAGKPITYSTTPEAQAMRRQWLQREHMLAEFRKARQDPLGGVEYVKAAGLIRMTEYLQTSAEERVALIDLILDVLDEVGQEE